MTTFTASEVRDAARNYNGDTAAPLDMLRAFADLLEAREKAVPVMVVNHVSSAEHDLPIGMKLYTHPASADAERLSEALRSIGERLSSVLCDPFGEVVVRGSDDDRQIIAQALKDLGELAAHSAHAQPPAASVTDAMVERALSAYYVRDIDSAGFAWEDAVGDPRIAESDMRAALEAALAAQENPHA